MRNKASKRKTPVMKKTLSPHYNHTFVYNGVRLEDLQHMCLELTVWDREPLASNDFLGGVRLGVGTGETLLHPIINCLKASCLSCSSQLSATAMYKELF
jgi:Ca2+-dependent lipid-binding protein